MSIIDGEPSQVFEDDVNAQASSIGALRITTGFWGLLKYIHIGAIREYD